MFTSIVIILLPFLAIAFLPVIAKSYFTSADLDEMGICLEESETSSVCPFQQSSRIVLRTTVKYSNA